MNTNDGNSAGRVGQPEWLLTLSVTGLSLPPQPFRIRGLVRQLFHIGAARSLLIRFDGWQFVTLLCDETVPEVLAARHQDLASDTMPLTFDIRWIADSSLGMLPVACAVAA